MALLRNGIYQVDHFEDAKNWRPHIIVFSASPKQNWLVIQLADSFNHKGLLTVISVISPSQNYQTIKELETQTRDYIEDKKVQGLVKYISASQPFQIIPQLTETYGIGPLVPNTVVLGDSLASAQGNWESHQEYCQMITQIHETNKNIVIFKENKQKKFGDYSRIDIWWRGLKGNGSLMLLLAHLLRFDWHWRRATILLKMVVENETMVEERKKQLQELINKLNINVIPEVLVSKNTDFQQTISFYSQTADLIFLGLAEPEENFAEYYRKWQEKTQNLPSMAFVMVANNFAFEEVLQKDEDQILE